MEHLKVLWPLLLVVIVAGLIRLLPSMTRKAEPGRNVSAGTLLSPAELSFFRVLQLAVENDRLIFSKFAWRILWNVMRTRRCSGARGIVSISFSATSAQRGYWGQIELDDASHLQDSRRQRDMLVDSILRGAGIPCVRIRARSNYAIADLRRELSGVLGDARGHPPK